jgi:hypothetical protein
MRILIKYNDLEFTDKIFTSSKIHNKNKIPWNKNNFKIRQI